MSVQSAANTPESIPAGESPTNIRFLMLALLALGVGSAYLSRNTTAANETLAEEFGITLNELGKILAGFSVGYFCTQVLGGWLGGQIGVRVVFPTFALIWSGCALWTSFAGTPQELAWSRICLGLAQGVMVPCTGQALRAWFPVRTRGGASSVPAVTMQVGGTIAIFLTAKLLENPGWRVAFRFYALTGAVWAIAFAILFRNRPEQHPWTNEAERSFIRDNPTATPAVTESASPWWSRLVESLRLFVTTRSLLMISTREFFRAASVAFILQWLPTYLQKVYVVTKAQGADMTGFVMTAFAAGIIPGGRIVDWLYHRTGSKWASRSLFPAVAFCGCGVCLAGALFANSANAATACICGGMFLAGALLPAVWAGVLDIGGRRSGIVLGLMNMMGTAGDALCNIACGRHADLIRQHEWNWAWFVVPVIAYNFIAAGFSLLINPDHPVPDASSSS